MKRNYHTFLFHSIAFLLLSSAILFLYSNTFQSPFTFDDSHILENQYITSNDISIQGLKDVALSSYNMRRVLPNISFALNYSLLGSDTWGFHLVNILIHAVTAFFFYLLARTTLTLPSIKKHVQHPGEIALVAALIWAVHPLQTNGVTYIIQRMTSMAGLFYILALLCYLKARITGKTTLHQILLFASAALFGIMALLCKENSGVLPIMIIGCELFLLQRRKNRTQDRKKMLIIFGTALITFLVICLLLLGTNPLDFILGGYGAREFTLGQRLLTETRIIFHYLGLLLLPLPSRLNLAYDYQLSTGLLAPPQTLLAIAGIAGMFFLIHFFYRRDRLTGFAIFWFLCNLAVESTFIPLELIFEHRMYLPSMFLILAGVYWIYRLSKNKTLAPRTVLIAAIILLSLFTWQRNGVWKNEITLWTDVIAKSPGSLRGYANLGLAYNNAKKYELAEQYLIQATKIGYKDRSGNFNYRALTEQLAKVHDGLSLVYRELHNYPKALSEANLALQLNPSHPSPLITLGIAYSKMNAHQRAYESFQKAAAMGLNTVDLYNNWAVSSFNLDKTEQAVNFLKQALMIDPEHPESHYNLGIAYGNLGMFEEAQREIALALKFRARKQQ